MSYTRVIPRDLFNESGLLKCLGRLWIVLEEKHGSHRAALVETDGDAFEIVQDESSGAISVENMPLAIDGNTYRLSRPLNSRRPWPLYVESDSDAEFEPVEVFDDDGNLTPDMLTLIAE